MFSKSISPKHRWTWDDEDPGWAFRPQCENCRQRGAASLPGTSREQAVLDSDEMAEPCEVAQIRNIHNS